MPIPDTSKIKSSVTANLNTVAIRVPSNKTTLAVLEQLDIPIAAPSANRSGKISPTSAEDVLIELKGKIETILNGGPSKVGVESTVIDLSSKKAKILRLGGVDTVEINKLVNLQYQTVSKKLIRSPGLSKSHYKPDKKDRINANKPKEKEGWLAFGNLPKKFKGVGISLSKKKCLKESAKNLYTMLRILDNQNISSIAVQKIPKKGLGLAINDRLERASHEE